MILLIDHPLIDDLIKQSLIPEPLIPPASGLIDLFLILESEALFVQIKCLPSQSDPESAGDHIGAVLLHIDVVDLVTPSSNSYRLISEFEPFNALQ
jgi:hypothetical protein